MTKLHIFRKTRKVSKKPVIVEFRKKRSFFHRFINIRKILVYVLLILLVYSGYLLLTNLKLNENLILRETEYRGLNRLKKSQLDVAIKGEFGQGMIGINLNKIEEQIESSFIEISNIKAEKFYPDKLVFQVEEKTARLVLANFNGKFLFDDKGEVLKSICREDIQKFNGFDYLMARGFGDPNGDYVEDVVINELGEDAEIEEFDFTQFPFEDKVKILDKLQNDKQQVFEQETLWIIDNLDLKLDMEIPVIKSWSEDCFTAGDRWDGALINFLADAYETIKVDLKYEVLDAKWDGEFRLIFILSNGTQIILSPSRTLDIQIEDLESILIYSKKAVYDYKLIDLSSQKVLVE